MYCNLLKLNKILETELHELKCKYQLLETELKNDTY